MLQGRPDHFVFSSDPDSSSARDFFKSASSSALPDI